MLGLIAIFVALSGGAYAALSLPKNSVTSKQVKDHSLLRKDFKGGQLPSGADGQDGAPGPQGPTGAAGLPGLSNLTTVDGPHVDVPPGGDTPADFNANCPSGTKVVGTGFYSSVSSVGFVLSYTYFVGGIMFNDSSVTAHDVHLEAVCAQVAMAGATTSTNVRARYKSDRANALRARR